MADAPTTLRIPVELLERIDALEGKGKRSAFARDAISAAIARRVANQVGALIVENSPRTAGKTIVVPPITEKDFRQLPERPRTQADIIEARSAGRLVERRSPATPRPKRGLGR